MERVQFQQEQMVLELKDLVDKNIFTKIETKQIMKKRTIFETTLVRRAAKKTDFLRYITYEMNLEQLRRKRIARLDLPPGPPTISDYALVRRQFHIFERALKRFKSDVGLWIQYIQLAKHEGARVLLGRITARALQLHPNKPVLYVIAASHELDLLSPSAARALLQRGIRMNPESSDMWREYVRMELGFIEGLRRRWDVLGISLMANDTAVKGKSKAEEIMDPSDHIGMEVLGEDGSSMQVEYNSESARLEEDEGAVSRQQIMQGVIVKSVMTNAAKALPQIGLFVQLKAVITEHPSPVQLQTWLLEHLYDLVRTHLEGKAEGMRLLVDRHLAPGLRGVALVDAIHSAHEELLEEVKTHGGEAINEVYAAFVEEWCQQSIDQHMKQYLIASLKGVIKQAPASVSLFSTHIRVLTMGGQHDPSVRGQIVRLGERYSTKVPESSEVWLARLEAEKALLMDGGEEQARVEEIWRLAREKVKGEEEGVLRVWIWGLEDEQVELVKDRREMHEVLLKESMSLRGVHEKLLLRYVTMVHEAMEEEGTMDTAKAWLQEVRQIGRRYLVSSRVWEALFEVVAGSELGEGKYAVLKEIYWMWRGTEGREEAGVTWSRWLAGAGRGGEAGRIRAVKLWEERI